MIDLSKYKTLFLDRDGVINIERKNDYVKNVSEFIFIDKSLEALALLSQKFKNIFIVTNQRGVGKGLMSSSDLDSVHSHMLDEIEKNGGKINHIFVCTDIDPSSINRKPNVGMAFLAKSSYPEIEFKSSIMVGNSLSDIEFGNRLGMYTVLVGDKYTKEDKIYKNISEYYIDLYQFALSLY